MMRYFDLAVGAALAASWFLYLDNPQRKWARTIVSAASGWMLTVPLRSYH